MYIFAILQQLPAWIQEYGPEAQTILQGIIEASKELATGPGKVTLPRLPSLGELQDALDLMMVKNLMARKMAQSSLISESDAHHLIESDLANLSNVSAEEVTAELTAHLMGESFDESGKLKAGGQILAGIANWLLTNGPKFASTLATMIQTLMPVILALFAGGAVLTPRPARKP